MTKDSIYCDTLDEVELINEAGNDFDEAKVMAGDMTPVFFGSALTNFGVETFLKTYLQYAPKPAAHKTRDDQVVQPTDDEFAGFVFKIQANMNPNHRDRIAFVRLFCGDLGDGRGLAADSKDALKQLCNS